MAINPINVPLPADLPENWTYGQTVGPNGTDVGLTTQHGYNYLMEQVNSSQECINLLGNSFSGLATLDSTGKLAQNEIPNIDCGIWDTNVVAEHNATEMTHVNLLVNGNATMPADDSTDLDEHIINPLAHQNLSIDGNKT